MDALSEFLVSRRFFLERCIQCHNPLARGAWVRVADAAFVIFWKFCWFCLFWGGGGRGPPCAFVQPLHGREQRFCFTGSESFTSFFDSLNLCGDIGFGFGVRFPIGGGRGERGVGGLVCGSVVERTTGRHFRGSQGRGRARRWFIRRSISPRSSVSLRVHQHLRKSRKEVSRGE